MRRLILAVIVGVVVALTTRIYRRLQRLRPPTVPEPWRRLGQRDADLSAALALRDRLDRVARQNAPREHLSVMRGVHAALEELVALVTVRHELEDYLRTPLAGRADELRAHAEDLSRAAGQARLGLERIYAELLTAVAADATADEGLRGPGAVRHAESVLSELKAHRQAEAEVRRLLAEHNPS